MKAHATTTVDERTAAFELIRRRLQGRLDGGPIEFASSLSLPELQPVKTDTGPMAAFKAATLRDLRHGTAGPVYIRSFGLSQAMRTVYDGGHNLLVGGMQ